MSRLPESRDARVLVVIAHPDDAEFWAGGTIARWTSEGVGVTYLVLTDGDAGGFDPSVPREDVPAIRRAEQRAAAAVLGVTDVQFLGRPEGDLAPSRELRREIVRVVRHVRPQRVLTWSPEWNWDRFRTSHPDHRSTGDVTLRSIYPESGNPFAHQSLEDEGLAPWYPQEIWLLNSRQPNHFVDVTATFDLKVAALRAHVSQTAHREHLETEERDRLAGNTSASGLASGRIAEAFQVVLNR